MYIYTFSFIIFQIYICENTLNKLSSCLSTWVKYVISKYHALRDLNYEYITIIMYPNGKFLKI